MSDDLSLFGDHEPEKPTSRDEVPVQSVAAWQIDLLRKALDARGLSTMAERQQAIEGAAGRPVGSLRELTHDEALQVLSRLAQATPAHDGSGKTAWDDRDEDTWIDRL